MDKYRTPKVLYNWVLELDKWVYNKAAKNWCSQIREFLCKLGFDGIWQK